MNIHFSAHWLATQAWDILQCFQNKMDMHNWVIAFPAEFWPDKFIFLVTSYSLVWYIKQFHSHAQSLKVRNSGGPQHNHTWPVKGWLQQKLPMFGCFTQHLGAVFHAICQVWLSRGPPELFTFHYCAWLWNWFILKQLFTSVPGAIHLHFSV